MKAKEISIGDIKSLDDFYILFEQEALYLESNHDITELLLKYKNKTTSDEEKQKLQWEVEAFLFSFLGTRIFSFSTSNGKEIGEIVEYPQLDEHQTEAFKYIKHRSVTSKSPLLKARYNHLLWRSIIKKNTSFALEASESYIQAIHQCYDLIEEDTSDYFHAIARLFENLIGIVNEGKVNVAETRNLASLLLYSSTRLSFWAKHGMLKDMLEYPKIFKATDFQKALTIFETLIAQTDSKGDDFALVN